jgi:hypothetical protein
MPTRQRSYALPYTEPRSRIFDPIRIKCCQFTFLAET